MIEKEYKGINFKINITKDWHELLYQSINTKEQLENLGIIDKYNANTIDDVIKKYPMRITPYYLSLVEQHGDPIWKQAIPDILEINDVENIDDPLFEEYQSPVQGLIHRYPDRVLFLVSNKCAMYCRHCMRKRKVGKDGIIGSHIITDETINNGIEYIKKHDTINEVIISGGDPLLLEDEELNKILMELKRISHVDIIRIHSRVPCTLPQRITKSLIKILKKYHPLYINTQFNHLKEITNEAIYSCNLLVDAGIPVGCQTVLLKGVNDKSIVMKQLMRKLIKIRIKPYYLHHPDLVRGTGHFRVSISKGLDIMTSLRGHISGLCVPQYMIDLPGGGGKIPLLPEYMKGKVNEKLRFKNFTNEIFEYPI
jgi:lysine 2,3-aminomutase